MNLMSSYVSFASVSDHMNLFCSFWQREREKSHRVEMWLDVARSLWHGHCAVFEKAGPCGQLQFAQAQRSWYGGRERGDWTQQLDLTNTERGQRQPTSDTARSCFGDWEKMLSDSERASSIMAALCLSARWLWEKREGERERREKEALESTSKTIVRETEEQKAEKEKERKTRRIWPPHLYWLTDWLSATGPLSGFSAILYSSFLQPFSF